MGWKRNKYTEPSNYKLFRHVLLCSSDCQPQVCFAPQRQSLKAPSSLVLITLCFHGPERTRGRNEFQTTSWATFSHSYMFGAQWIESIEHQDLQQVAVCKGVKWADSNRSRRQVNVPMWALFFHTLLQHSHDDMFIWHCAMKCANASASGSKRLGLVMKHQNMFQNALVCLCYSLHALAWVPLIKLDLWTKHVVWNKTRSDMKFTEL